MSKKWILLLVILLVAGLILPAGATQYNPPWAHNYGFYYPDVPTPKDTRLQATNAANNQSIVGYDAYGLHNSSAYVGYTNIKDDAVFFFIGHGINVTDPPYDRGGGVIFINDNGIRSVILAEKKGFAPSVDHYFLSSMSSELSDCLLVVWASCYSARTSSVYGNLVDMTHEKGADNVIGFFDAVHTPFLEYWSDRFWYRCLYGGSGGNPQDIVTAANFAKIDVLQTYSGYGGTNFMVIKNRVPYDYLNPARYGAV